jgi:hypothetical protein
MLNRTNRTLSANLNRLNLGTRSLVVATGEINGKSTLRVRHAHGMPMRDGMLWSFDPSIQPTSRIAIPTIPGLSSDVPGRPSVVMVTVVRPVVSSDVTLPAFPDWSAFADCRRDAAQAQTQVRSSQERIEAGRKPLKGERPSREKATGSDRYRSDQNAAAAKNAAAGG